jgi:predicted glycogen debranching enzyme
MIAFGPDVVRSYSQASALEWLETDGLGGYALGTVAGANARRYHGLLTAASRPPVGRVQLVNRLEEVLLTSGGPHALSCQRYPGAVHPDGFRRFLEFRLDPFPVWIFEAGGSRVKKSFFLRYGEATAVVLYEHVAGPAAAVEARPLLSARGHHHLGREDGRFDGRWRSLPGGVEVSPPGVPVFRLLTSSGAFVPHPLWYRRQSYEWEERRGLDFLEDVFSPGVFRLPLGPGEWAALVMTTGDRPASEAPSWAEQERRLRAELLTKTHLKGPLGRTLTLAADQFLVSRRLGVSVMAGYPWFEDWGRDAMISLPGLALATGRPDDAEKILDVWTESSAGGRTPNRFPEDGAAPDVFAPDAGLWMVWAVQQYLKATKDVKALKRWAPALRGIADAIEKGERHGVHMDRDGLVILPPEAAGLTWMDARVGDVPVTPRCGKPVEVQALWYNALEFLAELDLKLKDGTRGYEKLAAIARTSFNEKFWNEREGYLYDRLDGREKDASIRPNALLALSLPYEILDARRFRAVVERAERDLWVPGGLRTLSPSGPAYVGRHAGPPSERDRAYHQGTAWVWLLGPFCSALSKALGPSEETKERVAAILNPLRDLVLAAGLGTLPEILDGDAPHRVGGCPAQAWSVAEVLRILWEENIAL